VRVPPPPPGQAGAPAPQLHLPSDHQNDLLHTYWSTDGFPDIVNGSPSFLLAEQQELRERVRDFPDQASVAYLRELGVRTVVLHPRLAGGGPWQDANLRPVTGLPVRREERGDVVLYHLAPAQS
jgi:hypothetical protein